MRVTILPTLEAMAEVYLLPTTGGPASPRFDRYVKTMREDGVPAAGYNPMTSKPVRETILALIDSDAEQVAADAVREAGERLDLDDVTMFITVATPGIWTDRVATEVEHRLAPTNWSGNSGSILLWTEEDTTAATVRRETIAQVVRLAWIMAHEGPPKTAAEAMGQEGLAYALAGEAGTRDALVADALDIVGSDDALATKGALLYGDEAAEVMGYLPLGLPPRSGYGHAIACAHESLTTREAAGLLRSGWTPATQQQPAH